MASDWLGVSIAPDDTMFTVAPTWSRLDSGVTGLRVNSISITRGRQTEFDKTDTGSCTVIFKDTAGVLDPTNTLSPYYGKLISRPFAIAIRNPVTNVWYPLFRGVIDEAGYGLDKSQLAEETAITAVDALDYFANFELVPGLAGYVNAAANADGYVFYEDTAGTVDDRVFAVLQDMAWPSGLSSVFTGNVSACESVYSAGDKGLQVIQEAADAEFPTVANYYVDKKGFFQWHGRYARFFPDSVSATASNWTFNRWDAGDNAYALAEGRIKMQPPFGFMLSRAMIRNAALAYPQGVDQSDLSAYIQEDTVSEAAHGTRTWTAENLQILAGVTTGNTAKQEAQLFSQYIIDNYAQPQPRINDFVVGTEHPDGDFGPAAWAFHCGVDISDIINIKISTPNGGFAAVDFFVEGIQVDIRQGPGSLDNAFPIITTRCDLSPAAYWASNPFGGLPT